MKGTTVYARLKEAKTILAGFKPRVFEELKLTSTPRTERVFELVSSWCRWALVDGAHTEQTILPYLTRIMREHMDNGAYAHLETARS
ncbi:MAG: hypothetical protein ACHQQR_04405 [Gemmatimonadales bacterium]